MPRSRSSQTPTTSSNPYFLRSKANQMEMQLDEAKETAAADHSSNTDAKLNETIDSMPPCVICLIEEKVYACNPCGHMVMCNECHFRNSKLTEIRVVICPICRHRIKSYIRIYN